MRVDDRPLDGGHDDLANADDVRDSDVNHTSFTRDAMAALIRSPLFVIACCIALVLIVIAVAPQWFAGWFGHGDPRVCDLALSNVGPTGGHPFGFDSQGCDLYSNVIHGARASISVGLAATALTFATALILGTVAGFYGGIVDAIVSRLGDVFFGFPFLLGALVLFTAIGNRSEIVVAAVLTLFTWPALTRLMRGSVLQVMESDYVAAARALGATDRRLMVRHLLPNAVMPLVVAASLGVGGFIVAEAALTFLGVGLQFPAISWGLQLSSSQYSFDSHPHLLVFPGAMLSMTVLAFVVIGDRLRDAFDHMRR